MSGSGGNVCAVCGMSPAESVKLQSASSRILWWNHQKIDTSLCAECAEVVYYKMQTRTLTQGWWGPISAGATIFISISNLLRINAHRNSITHIRGEKEMIVRPRLKARSNPAVLVLSAIAFLIIGSIASAYVSAPAQLDSSMPTSYVGSCWSEGSSGDLLSRVDCSDNAAAFKTTFVTSDYNDCSDLYLEAGTQFACLTRID